MNESDYYQKVPNLLSSKPVPLGLLVLSENPWDKVNLDNSKSNGNIGSATSRKKYGQWNRGEERGKRYSFNIIFINNESDGTIKIE